MKRSEVIDNIACVLVANAPYHTDLDIYKLAKIAEEILDDLENRSGMLPPKNYKLNVHPVYGDNEDIMKWEPEDV